MSNFYTLLTNIGAALHANAQVQQTTVAWSHFALGDGNGAPVVPTQTQTGLRREVHRLAITSIEAHPDNPNWIVVEAVVPSDVGGWTVRESAIYGGPGGNTCIAVGNYPETYKPVLAEGAGREMVMRMIVEISSVATVKLLIDPAVAIASRAWVQSLVASPLKAGLVKLASVPQAVEGESQDTAVTPEGLKAALENPQLLAPVLPRIQALEARDFGISTQKWFTTTATRLRGVSYVADQTFILRIEVNVNSTSGGAAYASYTIDGETFIGATVPYGASAHFVSEMLIPKGATFSFQLFSNFLESSLKVREFRRGA